MPLGLINVPNTFQSLINSCFHDILDEFMTIYFDGLLIYSECKVEHKVNLCRVFDYLHKEILFVKYKKCGFRKDSAEYLSHIIW